MFKRILVPLDGSERAERAIPLAARIARASDGTIIFLRVVLPHIATGKFAGRLTHEASQEELEEAASYLSGDLSARYAGELAGIETEMEVVSGTSSPTIFSVALLENIDLIVMCSHGDTGLRRWVLGSVAQKAVRHSPVPILVLNEHGVVDLKPEAGQSLRVLVALDGSSLSETAVEPAARLSALLSAPAQGALHLLRVVDIPPPHGKLRRQAHTDAMMGEEARKEAEAYLSAVSQHLQEGNLANLNIQGASSLVVSSDVVGTIIKVAEDSSGEWGEGGCDLIALATHGRGGLPRLVMGSVTEHLLGSTRLPLLIVRSHETSAQTQEEETAEIERK